MTLMSHHLSRGLTVSGAAREMGIGDSQAEYCAELLHRCLLEDAIVTLDDRPVPAPPAPVIRTWQDLAACRGHGGLFFGPEGELRADRLVREARAATLCRSCPVVEQCLDLACRHREKGWWGGMNETGRRIYRDRQRRRAASSAA